MNPASTHPQTCSSHGSLAPWHWAGRKKVSAGHSPVMDPAETGTHHHPPPGSLLAPGHSCRAGHHRAHPSHGLPTERALAVSPGFPGTAQAWAGDEHPQSCALPPPPPSPARQDGSRRDSGARKHLAGSPWITRILDAQCPGSHGPPTAGTTVLCTGRPSSRRQGQQVAEELRAEGPQCREGQGRTAGHQKGSPGRADWLSSRSPTAREREQRPCDLHICLPGCTPGDPRGTCSQWQARHTRTPRGPLPS